MPPQNNSAQPSALTPDDHAANLALATHISTQLATPQQPAEVPQESVPTPQDAQSAPDLTPEVEALQKQVKSIQKQLDKEPKDEISEIRKMVEDALKEDSHE